MSPDLANANVGLLAASQLADFLLRTTAEWLFCVLLVRIAGSAKVRFNLWLALLLGFVAQWVWTVGSIARGVLPAGAAVHATGAANAALASGAGAAGARVAVAAGMAGMALRAMAALLAGYVVVVAWRMLATLVARARMARAMRYRVAPGDGLASSFAEALSRRREPVPRRCELWVLPGLASPATLGWWKPRVVIPPMCATQDAAELEAVFWHELKHVERRDALWNAIMRGCRNVLWFHPCVHHAARGLNAARELACDAAVVREHPQSRDVYASCLVRFARNRELAEGAAAAGIEMASGAALLSTRVRSILNEVTSASVGSRAWRAAVSVLLVGAMAATVPVLKVLFAAEVAAPAMQRPVVGRSFVVAKRRPVRLARTKDAVEVKTDGGAELAGIATQAALAPDEGLAAKHRGAMGVLTEATGMDEAAAGGDGSAGASGMADGPAAAAAQSWGTAAGVPVRAGAGSAGRTAGDTRGTVHRGRL